MVGDFTRRLFFLREKGIIGKRAKDRSHLSTQDIFRLADQHGFSDNSVFRGSGKRPGSKKTIILKDDGNTRINKKDDTVSTAGLPPPARPSGDRGNLIPIENVKDTGDTLQFTQTRQATAGDVIRQARKQGLSLTEISIDSVKNATVDTTFIQEKNNIPASFEDPNKLKLVQNDSTKGNSDRLFNLRKEKRQEARKAFGFGNNVFDTPETESFDVKKSVSFTTEIIKNFSIDATLGAGRISSRLVLGDLEKNIRAPNDPDILIQDPKVQKALALGGGIALTAALTTTTLVAGTASGFSAALKLSAEGKKEEAFVTALGASVSGVFAVRSATSSIPNTVSKIKTVLAKIKLKSAQKKGLVLLDEKLPAIINNLPSDQLRVRSLETVVFGKEKIVVNGVAVTRSQAILTKGPLKPAPKNAPKFEFLEITGEAKVATQSGSQSIKGIKNIDGSLSTGKNVNANPSNINIKTGSAGGSITKNQLKDLFKTDEKITVDNKFFSRTRVENTKNTIEISFDKTEFGVKGTEAEITNFVGKLTPRKGGIVPTGSANTGSKATQPDNLLTSDIRITHVRRIGVREGLKDAVIIPDNNKLFVVESIAQPKLNPKNTNLFVDLGTSTVSTQASISKSISGQATLTKTATATKQVSVTLTKTKPAFIQSSKTSSLSRIETITLEKTIPSQNFQFKSQSQSVASPVQKFSFQTKSQPPNQSRISKSITAGVFSSPQKSLSVNSFRQASGLLFKQAQTQSQLLKQASLSKHISKLQTKQATKTLSTGSFSSGFGFGVPSNIIKPEKTPPPSVPFKFKPLRKTTTKKKKKKTFSRLTKYEPSIVGGEFKIKRIKRKFLTGLEVRGI